MPIAIKNKSTQPNKTITFDFGDDNVLSYAVGIGYWKFTQGGSDHHVKKIALSLSPNQSSANQVTCTVNGTLKDSSGHTMKDSDSEVRLSCIAVVNSEDSNNLTIANADGIPNGDQSAAIALPNPSLSLGGSFLSGFNLVYDDGNDHHVRDVQTTAGFSQNGSTGYITSVAFMGDDSGNSADGTIDGGLVATSTSETGILGQAVVNQETKDSQTITFSQPLESAAVLIQDLQVAYGSDHHVKTIGGGCSGWSVSGDTVTLDDARAFVKDDSGHDEKSSESSVSLWVLAIPQSD